MVKSFFGDSSWYGLKNNSFIVVLARLKCDICDHRHNVTPKLKDNSVFKCCVSPWICFEPSDAVTGERGEKRGEELGEVEVEKKKCWLVIFLNKAAAWWNKRRKEQTNDQGMRIYHYSEPNGMKNERRLPVQPQICPLCKFA